MIREMPMEKAQKSVIEMIKDPSWQESDRDVPILSREEFNQYLRGYLKNSDLSDEGCNQMKRQLVDSGFLLDFNSLVVIKPQWLADTFKSIVSTKNEDDNRGKKGIVSLKQIVARLENNGFKLSQTSYNKLISIWKDKLNACISHPILTDHYIIPSLLDEERPLELNNQWNDAKNKNECVGRRYSLPFLPYGVFDGIFVKCIRLSHVIQFWRNGLLLCKNEESFLLLEITTNDKSRINSTEYVITIQATGNPHHFIWF